ncbi:DNA mismatch repair endonuclease MutL [Nodosilinea sp. LEGE 06152]|uniref:DNA mismatch repair endonuclease MutL n=1 Tax=Nodosilinea sp. LEGE 06152 TaxID=2777966 RepID=UPI00188274D4|nr:DNA mismatch repair endonuclease MutL [Nodosilinea sp. LEGE 06152]MBE9158434.1 DNA mismatch repair endonuclease MutL [Nodosilinea sp. LEGE 06152]
MAPIPVVDSPHTDPSRPIQPLPGEVVHSIAAGEVIDSLAAAVRELVENALDAGATHITVALWPEQGRVQVADNGIAMGLDNLHQAAIPHSTSKIRTQADLWQVQSLGFRGEALHSLAQVSQLEICSRPSGNESGWRVTYSAQGEPLATTPVAMAPGSVVTLTNLFDRWPARRQRLPAIPRQLTQVQRVIHHCALAHPTITWTAQLNDRPWLALTPSPTARGLVPQMVRAIAEVDLHEGWQAVPSTSDIDLATGVYGLIGLPDRCHRPRPDWVKVAVNGRLVTVPELEQGILQAFRHTLPRHRYPLAFVHLTAAPSDIDWNRRPDKSTLYLHQLDRWVTLCQSHIEALLGQQGSSLPDANQQQRVTQLLKTAEPGGAYGPADDLSASSLSDTLPYRDRPGRLRAIAQVHDRYILAEQTDGLCLIEQHIAHERVLYERLQDRWRLVPLTTPVVLEGLTEKQLEQFQRLELAPEEFGPNRWAIRQVPAPLGDRDDLPDALLELSLGGNLDTAQVAIACRTAIRNGTPMDVSTMQTLLDDWQQTRQPRTCPHGRPICLTLSETSLARFFRRSWVVGKSHGI